MRYANSLESLDSVSSSIQQARAYRWISEQLIKHILFTPAHATVKAYYYKKVGLVDLSTYGGKIKFEFWLSWQRWTGRPNSNFIFPP